ncbi:hypothetical protein MGWOODY_XGa2180 [hydrothermal vent metagenome]|uniref:Uncharacterized protein n=1 Tax=hydrothermal vent metagenome TaxID=652676 RepID=A0A170PSH9_9ZZZZ
MRDVTQPDQILHVSGFIQTEFYTQRLGIFRGCSLPQHNLCNIPRQQVGADKNQHRDHPQGDYTEAEPADNRAPKHVELIK